MLSLALMFCSVSSSPRALSAEQPLLITSSANGMSLVITKSPFLLLLTISLSATSNPFGTWMHEMNLERGVLIY
jgi:hypothetical protein